MGLINNPVFEEYKNKCEENNTKPSLRGFCQWTAQIENINKRWREQNNDSVTMVVIR